MAGRLKIRGARKDVAMASVEPQPEPYFGEARGKSDANALLYVGFCVSTWPGDLLRSGCCFYRKGSP